MSISDRLRLVLNEVAKHTKILVLESRRNCSLIVNTTSMHSCSCLRKAHKLLGYGAVCVEYKYNSIL